MNSIASYLHRHVSAALLALLVAMSLAGALGAYAQSADAVPGTSKQRTVLITGANRGIGLELARQYSADGWRVIGTARQPDAAAELHATGADVLQLDVTDQASVDQLAQGLVDQPIDVLINNAGIQPLMWTLAEIDIDEIERTLDVNTLGPVRVVRALLPNLRSGTSRKIVNITTNLASIAGNTDGGFYGYRESKAALNMFTKSVAAELGPDGFICIVLHPGWVKTDLGGPDAPLQVRDSVIGMRNVIGSLSPADNGTFWTYAGNQMAW
jgi:NAD(P)-dependent dehydrogenase (short-subunit alcohol dehydrogenase family)